MLKLYFLGAPRIELGDKPVELGRRKAIALLAYLALTEKPYTREAMATLLWPEQDQAKALANLRRVLWEINKTLGPEWLEIDRQQVALKRNPDCWSDVTTFQGLLKSCQQESLSAACLTALEEAADLYRGDFLAGFTLPDSDEFDDWQLFQSRRLRDGLIRSLADLAGNYEQNGSYAEALSYARRWLALDPFDEEAHRRMMRLYALMGQRAAALRQYESCRRILQEELDVEPEEETRTLYERIASGQWPERESQTTTKPSQEPPAASGNLPQQLTPFVDRDELEQTLLLLTDPGCRLLTLVGPGGSGKTRLSIEATRQILAANAQDYPDGTCFVALASLDAGQSIVATIAGQLGFTFHREGNNQQRQLLDFLRPKRMLLVLDNFEQLVTNENIELLIEMMASASGTKLLVTSRSRLNIYGEQVLSIAGLTTPEGDRTYGAEDAPEQATSYGSVRLFLQSARLAWPDFELTEENLDAIVRLCRLVDGMPLAIELAAAWSSILSPDDIEQEIKASLDFLKTDLQGVPDRQRSIRAVFEASWKMLTKEERLAFQRMSVFRGGFTRQAGQVVSGEGLATLQSLANKSWLHLQATGRFQVHELLRQYAHARLRDSDREWHLANDRHSDFYTELVHNAHKIMRSAHQKKAFDKVALEFDNIRAAWLWLVDRGHFERLIDELLPGLFRFALARTTNEELYTLIKQARLEDVKADPDANRRSAIWLTAGAYLKTVRTIGHGPLYPMPVEAVQAAWQNISLLEDQRRLGFWLIYLLELYAWGVDLEISQQRLTELLPELRAQEEPWALAQAMKVLGELNLNLNELAKARHYLSGALAIYDRFEDRLDKAATLRQLAIVAYTEQDYETAGKLASEAKDIFQDIGDLAGVGTCLHELAEINLKIGQFDEAFDYFQQRRHTYEELGHWRLVFESLHWESLQALRYSDFDHAMITRQQCLELCHDLDYDLGTAWGEWELGEIYRVAGNMDAALVHFEKARVLFEELSLERGIAFYHRGLAEIALVKREYAEARQHFHIYLEASEKERDHWNVSYALSGLGQAATGLEEYQTAEAYLVKALNIAFQTGARDLCMVALVGLAELSFKKDERGEAVELATFVAQNMISWRETKRQAMALLAGIIDDFPLGIPEESLPVAGPNNLDTVVSKLLAGR